MAPLQVLHFEPSATDAKSVGEALLKAGFEARLRRVTSWKSFETALRKGGSDLVVSEFRLPDGDDGGVRAVALAKKYLPDVPFVIVTHDTSEAAVTRALQAGADDYLFKHNLVRLAPAVERALRQQQAMSALETAQTREKKLADGLRAVLNAADELVVCPDMNTMLRRAVELARERLGAERFAIYLYDAPHKRICGTFGTDFNGVTADERGVTHQVGGWWARMVTLDGPQSQRWTSEINQPLHAYQDGRHIERGRGWIATTPLLSQGEIIGAFFNDTALSNAPLNELQQELIAVYGSLVANLIVARRTTEDLRGIASMAHCILFEASLEEQPQGFFKWFMHSGDETAAQRVLPLEVPAGSNYFREWQRCRHADDRQRIAEQCLEGKAIESGSMRYQQEYRCRSKSGEWRWLLEEVTLEPAPPTLEGRRRYRAIGVCTDITSRKQVEEQLVHSAFYDNLTGLANRALFLDRLSSNFNRAQRREHLFAVIFLDLDNFKRVNDTLGHEFGDDLLRTVARRLEKCLRPEDTAARFGGDEFAVLLGDIRDASDATRVAGRILHELEQPFHLGTPQSAEATLHHDVLTSASIGIALSRVPGVAEAYNLPGDLLRDADAAMYRAKALGRGRYELFDAAMHQRFVELEKMGRELQLALARSEFVIHYQPVWNGARQLRGFEALLRWNHPERGLMLPDDFLCVAEDTGTIVPIGEWVLGEACRQVKGWQEESGIADLFVSVNISARQFVMASLPLKLREILRASGLSSGSLKIEIPEGVLLAGTPANNEAARRLAALGVRLVVSNCGTGVASMAQLAKLPLAELKIDRCFINATEELERFGVAGIVIALARALGAEVGADGVETTGQWDGLRKLGCDFMRGWHLGKPVMQSEVAALLPRRAA